MFGVILVGVSGIFEEIATSIGKRYVSDGKESYYTFGFLIQFFSAVLICITGSALGHMHFSMASLPTFIARTMVAIVELQLATIAITKVDRGSYGFIRLATIPLILIFDLVLSYTVRPLQIVGMAFILIPATALFFLRHEKSKGLWIALVVAVLAAIDIALYKYNITHFNSVEAEQGIIASILAAYFFLAAMVIKKENPLLFLTKPIYFAQASASGLAYAVNSFAYIFAPASVMIAASRGFSVLFAILSGRFYFEERNFVIRLALFAVILIGLLLLI